MTEPAPQPPLLRSLGCLVRGLSLLFWAVPIGLIACVETVRGDVLRPLGLIPAILSTGALLYALLLLGRFQRGERVWQNALHRAAIFALVNVGLSPFLYWWSRIPNQPFYAVMAQLMALSGVGFLLCLNPVLVRLANMLPDETLRQETRLFARVNCLLLGIIMALLVGYFVMLRWRTESVAASQWILLLDRSAPWLVLFLGLLPTSLLMALAWKAKEVIYQGVFNRSSGP